MNRTLALSLATALFLGISCFAADQGESKGQGSLLAKLGMRAKLEFSKSIMDGLAVNDFGKIEEGAVAMRGLNEVEHFVRRRSPAYTAQLNVFRIATDGLVQSAQEKNLDGATLAFTQMTTSCVNCHRVLRSAPK